jgi:hypothetical protein
MLKDPVLSHVRSPVHNLMVMKELESKHNAGRVEPTDGSEHMPSGWEHGIHILNLYDQLGRFWLSADQPANLKGSPMSDSYRNQ